MKKIFRIFLLVLLIGFVSFGSYILYEELFIRDFFLRLKNDPSLLIPLVLTLLSIPSLLFNIEKLLPNNFTQFYKWLRILDLIFSISLFILCTIGFILLLDEDVFYQHQSEDTRKNLIKAMIIFALIYLLSVLVFIDNIIYQKNRNNSKSTNKSTIDDIGNYN